MSWCIYGASDVINYILTHLLLGKGSGSWRRKQFVFSSLYCLLFPFHNRKSMFAILHSDIKSLKSGLLHFYRQALLQKLQIRKSQRWNYKLYSLELSRWSIQIKILEFLWNHQYKCMPELFWHMSLGRLTVVWLS